MYRKYYTAICRTSVLMAAARGETAGDNLAAFQLVEETRLSWVGGCVTMDIRKKVNLCIMNVYVHMHAYTYTCRHVTGHVTITIVVLTV